MWEEFKTFIARGNALDLAVGVIIGAAFGKIVEGLVNDILMPIIGIAGKADFSNYFVPPCRRKEAGRRVRLWRLHHSRDQFPHRRHSLVLHHPVV